MAKMMLIGAGPPIMIKREANRGIPAEAFDANWRWCESYDGPGRNRAHQMRLRK